MAASCLSLLPLHAETLFTYFGEDEIPVAGENSPAIVTGELGKLKELEFKAGDPDSETDWADFIELPLSNGEYRELTIALFLKPERADQNECLVACKWDTGNSGFRLQKSWGKWLLDAGDGTQAVMVPAGNRDADLAMHEWQHLAVTFKDGHVRFYKDGILVHEEKSPIESILVDSPLRIGAGMGKHYSFAGRMGGVYIAAEALDDTGIVDLIQRANP